MSAANFPLSTPSIPSPSRQDQSTFPSLPFFTLFSHFSSSSIWSVTFSFPSLPCLAFSSFLFTSSSYLICVSSHSLSSPSRQGQSAFPSLPFLALFSPPLTLPLPHLWSVANPIPIYPPSRSRQEQSSHPQA